jgi:hypothetical protein
MAAFNAIAKLWTNGIIPYEPNPTHPFWSVIVTAMREVHAKTVVRFVERAGESRHIWFTSENIGNGTFPDGRVNIDKNVRSLHELGHVIGLIHEHQRPDRDKHILLHRDNMSRQADGSFSDKAKSQLLELLPMGSHTDYDIGSSQHYWYTAHSVNEKTRTITYIPRPNYKFDTPEELSPLDVDAINGKYKVGIARVSFAYEKRVSDPEHRGPVGDWFVDTDPVYCTDGYVLAGLELTKRGNFISSNVFCRKPENTGGKWTTPPAGKPSSSSEKRLRQYALDTNPVFCPEGRIIKGFGLQVQADRVSPRLWCTTPEGADGRWVARGASDASDGGSFVGRHIDTNKIKAPARLDATGVALWVRGNRVAPMLYHR